MGCTGGRSLCSSSNSPLLGYKGVSGISLSAKASKMTKPPGRGRGGILFRVWVSWRHCGLLLLRRFRSCSQGAAAMASTNMAKKTNDSVNNRLALGYKTVVRFLRSSKAKLILVANKHPPLQKYEVEYLPCLQKLEYTISRLAMLAKVGVHHFNGSSAFPHPMSCNPDSFLKSPSPSDPLLGKCSNVMNF